MCGEPVHQIHVPFALLASGWRRDVLITIEGRLIAAVAAHAPAPPEAERLSGTTLPGIANVHSHAFQRAMAGRIERRGREDDDFWTWRQAMYRLLERLTPDDVEGIAAWGYVEMLEAGFTSVGEFHYLHHDRGGAGYGDPAEMAGRIVAAAQASGIGLTLLPAFYAHGGCGARPARPEQARFVSNLDGFCRLMEAAARHVARLEGAILGAAPHSLRAVDAGELRRLTEHFTAGPIHMHVAEQIGEVEECLAWSGARPVEWLLDNAPLDQRWCLVHCTHMTSRESWLLARSGAVAGLAPITEANLGDGIFTAPRFLKAGGRMAVGSDSNVRISLSEELRTLEYGQRLRDRKRNRLAPAGASTGRFLCDVVRRGGAQALGSCTASCLGASAGPSRGGIAPGQIADLVVLEDRHPALVGHAGDSILDAWVFAGGDGIVRDVFAAGRRVVSNGRHVNRDALRQRFATILDRLRD
jgi:formiminoglutamate deiminase